MNIRKIKMIFFITVADFFNNICPKKRDKDFENNLS